MSETDLYGPICIALCKEGHRAFRNHVGIARHRHSSGKEYTVRHGFPAGSSDILGWTASGLFLSIEVKLPGWKPSPKWLSSNQAAWLRTVSNMGGVAGVAISAEEAVAISNGFPCPVLERVLLAA